MKRYLLKPEGWPCMLSECLPGLFVYRQTLGIKTEYSTEDHFPEVYCADTGEAFWGGVTDKRERNALLVQPVIATWEDYEE